MRKTLLSMFLLLYLSVTSFTTFSQCDVLYVSTTGISTGAGTQVDPLDIVTAFSTAPSDATIKIATGTYNVLNPLILASDGVKIVGGFEPSLAWSKTSLAGATTINRSNINLEGTANKERLVAIYIDSKSNFSFQDITISTSSATSPGASTYCVHLSNCSDYSFTRTQVLPGNAAAGQNGIAGTPGANGSNGGSGTAGDIDNTNASGTGGIGGSGGGTGYGAGGNGGTGGGGNNGTQGLTSTALRAGGGGGGGASGGSGSSSGKIGGNGGGVNGGAIQTSGGTGGSSGDPGSAGGTGIAGQIGANGPNGAIGSTGNNSGGYFIPGTQGTSGSDGFGGKGGTGGGGGGGQSCFFCIDGSGDGAGGGGGGGQGGSAGTGGHGGGASFGFYLLNNGINGVLNDSWVVAGAAGAGGNGGAGGIGGNGGNGGAGSTYGTGEVGRGGNGGVGGKGGNAGAGGTGVSGIASGIYLASGTALNTNINNFNLAAQPVILVEEVMCTNENIGFSAAISATWSLGAGATPLSTVGSLVTTQYAYTGLKDIVYGANTYTSFVNITCDAPGQPTLAANNMTVCPGGSVTLQITAGNLNNSTDWEWYSGSCGGTGIGTGTSITLNAPLGSTTYYARGIGGCQNPGGCNSITILVQDNTAPVPALSSLSDVTASCEVTSLTAPTASDACMGTITASHNATLPLTSQGTTSVTWTYDDGNGNSSTQTQNVIIDDVTAPVPNVSSLPDLTATCELTSMTPTTAADECSGNIVGTNDAVLPITFVGTTFVTWTYMDGEGNSSSQIQNVIITCGSNSISENSLDNSISVYPNPTNGIFTISSTEHVQFTFVNELGQEIQQFSVTAGIEKEIILQTISDGIYYLKGINSNGTILKRVIVKK